MNRVLTETAAAINKRFGAGTICWGREHLEQGRYSTGFESLDIITGGIPKGRIVEVFGAEATGKSALALHLARQAGEVLYMDTDNGLVDKRRLCTMSPKSLEDSLGGVEIAAPAFDAIVIDTLTALPTRAEAGAELGNFQATPRSSEVLAHALPRLVPTLLRNSCTLFVVTQLRNIPGVMYGRLDKSSGGRAIRHYAALWLETCKIEAIRQKSEIAGQLVRVIALKNKFGGPFKSAQMNLIYGQGWRAAICRTKRAQLLRRYDENQI